MNILDTTDQDWEYLLGLYILVRNQIRIGTVLSFDFIGILHRRITCGYPWLELEGKDLRHDPKSGLELAMPSYFHKKFHWGTVFATERRSFIEPGTGLRMKRTNHRTRVPIGLYLCHIEEKMTIKEVRGESVMEWKTKVTTKEGTIIKFPGKFCGYKLATEE
ncbi:hypothetical protein Tco_1294322 [Tanacetum coccineum]